MVRTKQTMRKNQRKDGDNVREKFKATSPIESQGNLVNRRSLVISIIIFHYEIAAVKKRWTAGQMQKQTWVAF